MESLKSELISLGLSTKVAQKIMADITAEKISPEYCLQQINQKLLSSQYPFEVYQLLYKTIYPNWASIPAPAWFPDEHTVNTANITKLMIEKGLKDYVAFHHWSTTNRAQFWQSLVNI